MLTFFSQSGRSDLEPSAKRMRLDPSVDSDVESVPVVNDLCDSDKSVNECAAVVSDCVNVPVQVIPKGLIKPSPSVPKGSKGRDFQTLWQESRPWLTYNPVLRNMFCKTCAEAGVVNAFTRGCGELKLDAVKKHESTKGPSGHRAACDKLAAARSMQQATATALRHNEDAVIALMKNIYYSAKKENANSDIHDLNELVRFQGVKELDSLKVDKHTHYEHSDSVRDIQEAVCEVISENLFSELQDADCFSIMIDESTDIAADQNLMVYIRFVCKGVAKTSYFRLARLPGAANAENITNLLIRIFEDQGIHLTDHTSKPLLVGIATDGAATMVGRKSGVVTRLKEKVPHLVSLHCIAHRLALAAGQAADNITYLVKYQEKVNSIFKYFDNSPKNLRNIEAVQQVLYEAGDVTSEKGRRFVQVFATRWLSFEGSLTALITNMPALICLLISDSKSNAKAKGLLKTVASYKFMHVTHFLADVMNQLAHLSRVFQTRNLNFSVVNASVQACIDAVNSYTTSDGPTLRKFKKLVPASPEMHNGQECFIYHEHMILDSNKQRSDAVSACEQFVGVLVDNLEARFLESGDQDILSALFTIFNPKSYPINQQELASYGMDAIDLLEEHFGVVLPKTVMCSSEFDTFKRLVVSNFRLVADSVQELCKLTMLSHAESFPGMATLASVALTVPVHSVDCERGFSRQNLVKTKLRNCLNETTLHRLLLISIEGPPLLDFDFPLAMKKWSTAKSRRIFSIY